MGGKVDISGIILLDKPEGMSSNRALQKVKGMFGAKKAGHTGSLDPIATGLLPICFGEATKFSQYLLDADKSYRVTAKLGITTTTADSEGEIVLQRDVPEITGEQLESVLAMFRGPIEQVPPMHSALKHQGKPLYKLARRGIEIDRPARQVHIYSLACLHIEGDSLSLEVDCSKGTYIRSLVQDIGEALGVGAHVTELRRTAIAGCAVEHMHALAHLQSLDRAVLREMVLPTDTLLQHFPHYPLTEEEANILCHGQEVPLTEQPEAEVLRLMHPRLGFMGLGYMKNGSHLAAKRLLNTQMVLA